MSTGKSFVKSVGIACFAVAMNGLFQAAKAGPLETLRYDTSFYQTDQKSEGMAPSQQQHRCHRCHVVAHSLEKHTCQTAVDRRMTTVVEGRQREYEIHLPRRCNGASSWPVIYVLPGVGESIEFVKSDTRLNDKADQSGFAVVYLQPLPRILGLSAWSLEHGAVTEKDPAYDDLAYVRQVRREVRQAISVRTEHLIGHSEGGSAAQFIANKMPGVFAGVAGVKSTRMGGDPNPTGGIPKRVIFVIGGADDVLPPAGGAGNPIILLAAPNVNSSRPLEQIRAYVEALHCAAPRRRLEGSSQILDYACTGGAEVKVIYRNDGDHGWNDAGSDTTRDVTNFLLRGGRARDHGNQR